MPSLTVPCKANKFVTVHLPLSYNVFVLQKSTGVVDVRDSKNKIVLGFKMGGGHLWKKVHKPIMYIRNTVTEEIVIFYATDDRLYDALPVGGSFVLPNVLQVQGAYPLGQRIDPASFQPLMLGAIFDNDAGNPPTEPSPLRTYSGFGLGVESHVVQVGVDVTDGTVKRVVLPTARQGWQDVPYALVAISDLPNPAPAFTGQVQVSVNVQNFNNGPQAALVRKASDLTSVAGGTITATGLYYVCLGGMQEIDFQWNQAGVGVPGVNVAFVGSRPPFVFS